MVYVLGVQIIVLALFVLLCGAVSFFGVRHYIERGFDLILDGDKGGLLPAAAGFGLYLGGGLTAATAVTYMLWWWNS